MSLSHHSNRLPRPSLEHDLDPLVEQPLQLFTPMRRQQPGASRRGLSGAGGQGHALRGKQPLELPPPCLERQVGDAEPEPHNGADQRALENPIRRGDPAGGRVGRGTDGHRS